MRFHMQQAFRAIILLLFAIYIIKLHYTGDILKLINPKYDVISQLGVIILLVLFVAQLQRVWSAKSEDHDDDHADHNHDHGYSSMNIKKLVSYSIVVFPLLTGFLLPPSTLNASIAEKKGAMMSITNSALNNKKEEEELAAEVESSQPEINLPDDQTQGELENPPENDLLSDDNPPDPNLDSNTYSQEEFRQMAQDLEKQSTVHMDDSVYTLNMDIISMNLEKYEGKEIVLNGFVYKEEGLKDNQFVLARFIITHCVADAGVTGFLSELDEAVDLQEDTWLEAKGTIAIQEYNGVDLPMIKITEWKKIEELEQPYIYPHGIMIR
ncbi:TIGR03943 family protein [Aquibacillus halophilus]|uniref:TIGR03943 family protein n=1 Tax=Aquibacillus halophilus TaxID=930132 RepID=A0A6A8DIG7_9BACI|nr:TIGR03943 family protein [Aquibacillus halophilus]MRH43589.1 TIGR03943 family protein [Aquibacillus halophilus]